VRPDWPSGQELRLSPGRPESDSQARNFTVKSNFRIFFSLHYRNRLRNCGDVVAKPHFFKKLQTAEQNIVIEDVQICSCGATFSLKNCGLLKKIAIVDFRIFGCIATFLEKVVAGMQFEKISFKLQSCDCTHKKISPTLVFIY
jgi:hypothetical protein